METGTKLRLWFQLRQDAAVSLQMIALDAHERARNMDQHQRPTFIAQVPVSEILSSYYNLCQQQLGHVTDVQHEVIVETTTTSTDSAAALQQPVSR